MTRERAKKLLPIIQAYAEGKEIQYKTSPSSDWRFDYPETLLSFRDDYEYRIKPEPREFYCWINEYGQITAQHTPAHFIDKTGVFKVREVIE